MLFFQESRTNLSSLTFAKIIQEVSKILHACKHLASDSFHGFDPQDVRAQVLVYHVLELSALVPMRTFIRIRKGDGHEIVNKGVEIHPNKLLTPRIIAMMSGVIQATSSHIRGSSSWPVTQQVSEYRLICRLLRGTRGTPAMSRRSAECRG